jgi:hypothetical protein
MAKFRISSHGRLQDWIAAEKGYFEEKGSTTSSMSSSSSGPRRRARARRGEAAMSEWAPTSSTARARREARP